MSVNMSNTCATGAATTVATVTVVLTLLSFVDCHRHVGGVECGIMPSCRKALSRPSSSEEVDANALPYLTIVQSVRPARKPRTAGRQRLRKGHGCEKMHRSGEKRAVDFA